MITLQDHIEELRAELRGCLDASERAAIARELEAVLAAHETQDGTAGICARDPRQPMPQLLGRLMGVTHLAESPFLAAVRRHVIVPAVLTQRPTLTPPGAEIARLEGHGGSVAALAMLPDGRLGSGDRTIRLWDLASGSETAVLEGHDRGVGALVVLPDGRLASGYDDGTIRMWDFARGAETTRLKGHGGRVQALVVLPDGRLASGGTDGTIRLWDSASGAETICLEGHSGRVQALAALPDGRLVSGGYDRTIRLWDLACGTEIARLELDSAATCVAPLSDGRLVAGDVLGRLHWLVIVE